MEKNERDTEIFLMSLKDFVFYTRDGRTNRVTPE